MSDEGDSVLIGLRRLAEQIRKSEAIDEAIRSVSHVLFNEEELGKCSSACLSAVNDVVLALEAMAQLGGVEERLFEMLKRLNTSTWAQPATQFALSAEESSSLSYWRNGILLRILEYIGTSNENLRIEFAFRSHVRDITMSMGAWILKFIGSAKYKESLVYMRLKLFYIENPELPGAMRERLSGPLTEQQMFNAPPRYLLSSAEGGRGAELRSEAETLAALRALQARLRAYRTTTAMALKLLWMMNAQMRRVLSNAFPAFVSGGADWHAMSDAQAGAVVSGFEEMLSSRGAVEALRECTPGAFATNYVHRCKAVLMRPFARAGLEARATPFVVMVCMVVDATFFDLHHESDANLWSVNMRSGRSDAATSEQIRAIFSDVSGTFTVRQNCDTMRKTMQELWSEVDERIEAVIAGWQARTAPPDPTDPFFWTKESFVRMGLVYKGTSVPAEMTLLTPQYHCVATELRAARAAPADAACHGYFKERAPMRVCSDPLIGFDADSMRPSHDPEDAVERLMWRPIRIDLEALFDCNPAGMQEKLAQAHRRGADDRGVHFVNMACAACSSGLSPVVPAAPDEAFFAAHAALYLREVARAESWDRLQAFTPFGRTEHGVNPDIATRMALLSAAAITADLAAARQKAIAMYCTRLWIQMYMVLNGLVAAGPGGRVVFPFNTAMMRPVVELASKTRVPDALARPLPASLPAALRVRFRFATLAALRCAVSAGGRMARCEEASFGLAVSPGERTLTLYVAWDGAAAAAPSGRVRVSLERAEPGAPPVLAVAGTPIPTPRALSMALLRIQRFGGTLGDGSVGPWLRERVLIAGSVSNGTSNLWEFVFLNLVLNRTRAAPGCSAACAGGPDELAPAELRMPVPKVRRGGADGAPVASPLYDLPFRMVHDGAELDHFELDLSDPAFARSVQAAYALTQVHMMCVHAPSAATEHPNRAAPWASEAGAMAILEEHSTVQDKTITRDVVSTITFNEVVGRRPEPPLTLITKAKTHVYYGQPGEHEPARRQNAAEPRTMMACCPFIRLAPLVRAEALGMGAIRAPSEERLSRFLTSMGAWMPSAARMHGGSLGERDSPVLVDEEDFERLFANTGQLMRFDAARMDFCEVAELDSRPGATGFVPKPPTAPEPVAEGGAVEEAAPLPLPFAARAPEDAEALAPHLGRYKYVIARRAVAARLLSEELACETIRVEPAGRLEEDWVVARPRALPPLLQDADCACALANNLTLFASGDDAVHLEAVIYMARYTFFTRADYDASLRRFVLARYERATLEPRGFSFDAMYVQKTVSDGVEIARAAIASMAASAAEVVGSERHALEEEARRLGAPELLEGIFSMRVAPRDTVAFLHRVMCLQLLANIRTCPEYKERVQSRSNRAVEEHLMTSQIATLCTIMKPAQERPRRMTGSDCTFFQSICNERRAGGHFQRVLRCVMSSMMVQPPTHAHRRATAAPVAALRKRKRDPNEAMTIDHTSKVLGLFKLQARTMNAHPKLMDVSLSVQLDGEHGGLYSLLTLPAIDRIREQQLELSNGVAACEEVASKAVKDVVVEPIYAKIAAPDLARCSSTTSRVEITPAGGGPKVCIDAPARVLTSRSPCLHAANNVHLFDIHVVEAAVDGVALGGGVALKMQLHGMGEMSSTMYTLQVKFGAESHRHRVYDHEFITERVGKITVQTAGRTETNVPAITPHYVVLVFEGGKLAQIQHQSVSSFNFAC